MTSDTTSFSLRVKSKSNKNRNVKFIIAISNYPEPPSKKLYVEIMRIKNLLPKIV